MEDVVVKRSVEFFEVLIGIDKLIEGKVVKLG